MYSPNPNPTEIYHSRQALLMQEARNRRLARRQRRAARSWKALAATALLRRR